MKHPHHQDVGVLFSDSYTGGYHCERSEAISSGRARTARDCFVASLLAMTEPLYSAASRGGSAASIAARSFGGDIGRSRSRMPVAALIALATAAIGGTIGTSPQPRAPNGWRGFGTSIRIVSIIGISEATGTR